MPYSQADLDAIDQALLQPELTVRFSDGRLVTYRTTDDLLKIRSVVDAQLRAAPASADRNRLVRNRVRYSSGLASSYPADEW